MTVRFPVARWAVPALLALLATPALAGGYVGSPTDPDPVVVDTSTNPEPVVIDPPTELEPEPAVIDTPTGPEASRPEPVQPSTPDKGGPERAPAGATGPGRGGDNPDPFWLAPRRGAAD